jgi:hypothetical protein
MSSTAQVIDLDIRDALLAAADARRTADREEARLLALAVQLVHLHPVGEDTAVASFADPSFVPDQGDPSGDHLAGEGTPQVAERAVVELAAAIGASYLSGCRLVADSLELRYRLPRLWTLVQAGRLQAWKARRVAQHTTGLGHRAVAFVDAHAAIPGARNRLVGNVAGLVHAALCRFEPNKARQQEQDARERRGVEFDYRPDQHDGVAGTATLTAHLDLGDAKNLDTAITATAHRIGELGDQSPLDTRRARALGLLAHPQRVLDLFAECGDPEAERRVERNRSGLVAWATGSTTSATVFVHVTSEDLRAWQHGTPAPGTVEKLGSATLDLIRDWLQRTSGVIIKPVLDLSRSDAVDAHDPPEWMRDLVILRDGHCVFPGCTTDARACNLDHIDPYVPIDEGGPPAQTTPANLACLCRRHHRLKTFTSWRYERAGPGDYAWTNRTASLIEAGPSRSADRRNRARARRSGTDVCRRGTSRRTSGSTE